MLLLAFQNLPLLCFVIRLHNINWHLSLHSHIGKVLPLKMSGYFESHIQWQDFFLKILVLDYCRKQESMVLVGYIRKVPYALYNLLYDGINRIDIWVIHSSWGKDCG